MEKTHRGFTLIEVMVVISIIGILAGLGFTNYTEQMKKARDGKRKADLKQIRAALEMYYADRGYYPPVSSCNNPSCPGGWDCNQYYFSTGGNDWIPGLAQYIGGRIPKDPINTGGGPWTIQGYTYAYGNVGKCACPGKFDLTAQLESTQDPDRCVVKQWKFGSGFPPCSSLNWCGPGGYLDAIYEDSPQ